MSELFENDCQKAFERAEIHLSLAKAAMKVAAKNHLGAELMAEHLENAAKVMREYAIIKKSEQ